MKEEKPLDKLKHLFVVRHGEYTSSPIDHLTDNGKKQIKGLAEKIKEILECSEIPPSELYLLSSTAFRTEETAWHLGCVLGVPSFDFDPILYTEGGKPLDENGLKQIDALLLEPRTKHAAIAVISHYELVNSYPTHFLKTEFNCEGEINWIDVGQCVHFDLEAKRYKILGREPVETEKSKRLIFYAETFVECSGDCDTSRYLHVHEDGTVDAVWLDGENVSMTRPNDVNRWEGTTNIGAERADSLAQRLYDALSEFPNPSLNEDTEIENHGQYGNIHYSIDLTYKGQTQKIKWWAPPGETPEEIRPLRLELQIIWRDIKKQIK